MGKALAFFLSLAIIFTAGAQEIALDTFKNKWSGSYSQVQGESFFRARVQGNDHPSYIEKVFEPAISFKEKFVKVKLRVSDLSKLFGIELRLSSEAEGYSNFFAIPVPLFTDVDFNTVQTNSWVTYTFTMGEARVHGTPDINSIVRLGFYLGGQEVDIDFKLIELDETFPQSIVTFTFDDGYDDNYVAAKIMAKYNFAGTAYLMPRQINLKNYVTQDQVTELGNVLGWDISSHHKIPIVDFSYEELEAEIEYTKDFLIPFGSKNQARHFAYPLGKQNRKTTLPLIRRMFDTARIAGGGAETLPPADWHMLRTFNVQPHLSPQDLINRVRSAAEHGEWLILMFHYITDEENPSSNLAYNKDKFDEFCRLLDQEGSLVLTVNDVYQAFER